MTQKKCIYCDTIYPMDTEHCPLCGGSSSDIINVEEEPVSVPTPAPETMPGKSRNIKNETSDSQPQQDTASVPRWMTAVITAVLAVALVVGLAFIGYSIGLFDGNDAKDDQLYLPLDPDSDSQQGTQNNQNSQSDQENMENDDSGSQPDQNRSDENQLPIANQDGTTAEPDQPQGDDREPDLTGDPTDSDEPDNPEEPVHLCTGITLNHTDVTLFQKGETFTIRATLNPSDCDEELVWSSSDEAYATVDKTGKVTAVNGKKNGSVKIIATCGSQTEECVVRLNFAEVEDPSSAETDTSSDYSLNLADFTMSYNGEQVEVEVKNASIMTDSFAWSIDDTEVASIVASKNTCIVTARTSGTTKLRVSINGQTELICIVRCSKAVGDGAETP